MNRNPLDLREVRDTDDLDLSQVRRHRKEMHRTETLPRSNRDGATMHAPRGGPSSPPAPPAAAGARVCPVGGWPAGEIFEAMTHTKGLEALVPIDLLGMLTDLNPDGLDW